VIDPLHLVASVKIVPGAGFVGMDRGALCDGCGQLLMYRYFRNSILIDLLPELFPPGFRERERTQA
jgi:hypothetical protein